MLEDNGQLFELHKIFAEQKAQVGKKIKMTEYELTILRSLNQRRGLYSY